MRRVARIGKRFKVNEDLFLWHRIELPPGNSNRTILSPRMTVRFARFRQPASEDGPFVPAIATSGPERIDKASVTLSDRPRASGNEPKARSGSASFQYSRKLPVVEQRALWFCGSAIAWRSISPAAGRSRPLHIVVAAGPVRRFGLSKQAVCQPARPLPATLRVDRRPDPVHNACRSRERAPAHRKSRSNG